MTNDTLKKTTNRLYSIWWNMKTRCNNPNYDRYKDYGARWIEVCKKWETFEWFYIDMWYNYKKHFIENNWDTSIDRIDNDGNYYKENCKWSTCKEQSSNRRNTKTHTKNT